MNDPEELSVQLVNEIMQLEHKIESVKALNGNKEDNAVKQYQKFIEVKKSQLYQINKGYQKIMLSEC